MKLLFSIFFVVIIDKIGVAQISKIMVPKMTYKSATQIVEAACGECQFKMDGKGCDLAVRINGKTYFVDGTNIDEHGDAHAADGFCKKIRKAEVNGTFVNNRFIASYFKMRRD